MPRLPSGFMVGVESMKPDEMLECILDKYPGHCLFDAGGEMEKQAVDIEAIKQFVRVTFYRKSEEVVKYAHDARSEQPPEDMEPYESGYTLADYPHFATEWPDDDKVTFDAFLESEKVSSYLKDVMHLAQNTGRQYQNNLRAIFQSVGDEATDDGDENWDDYDLNSAVLLLALLPEPEEQHKLDLWMRMHAMRWHTLPMLMGAGNLCSDMPRSFTDLSDSLRAFGNLENLPAQEQQWLHKQQVVFANDLCDLYEAENLKAVDCDAYRVIKYFALAEPSR